MEEEKFNHAVELYNNTIQKIMNDISVEIDISSEPQPQPPRPKLFVSLPMGKRTKEECKKVMNDVKEEVERYLGQKVKLLDTWFEDEPDSNINAGIFYLGKSLGVMAEADVIAFATGWADAKGCIIEHQVAEYYNIERIIEF